jgi:hypothetical protein
MVLRGSLCWDQSEQREVEMREDSRERILEFEEILLIATFQS